MKRVFCSAILGGLLLAASFGHAAPPTVRYGSNLADIAPEPRPAPTERIYQLPREVGPITIHQNGPFQTGDTKDWGHGNINVAESWKRTKGKGAVVAILDTGCDFNHRDLKGQVIGQKDFSQSSGVFNASGPILDWLLPWRKPMPRPPVQPGAWDVNGHGTHCAGVVAAAENNTGMVGVAPDAKLLIGKVLNDSGSGSSKGIADGIRWAVDNGADVISMSLGGGGSDAYTAEAVKYAWNKGVILVSAAGNSGNGNDTIDYPAKYAECVCVGATDSNNAVAGFSSRGPRLEVCAPGVAVRSCYPGDRFATMSGTSMATPYVAGCAALYVGDCKARGIKPSPAQFRLMLMQTSRDLPPQGWDKDTGSGLIQSDKLFAQPEPKKPIPEPTLPVPPKHPRTATLRVTFTDELTDAEWEALKKSLAKIGAVELVLEEPKK